MDSSAYLLLEISILKTGCETRKHGCNYWNHHIDASWSRELPPTKKYSSKEPKSSKQQSTTGRIAKGLAEKY